MMKNRLLFLFVLSFTTSFAQLPKQIFQGDGQEDYKPGEFTIAKRTVAQSAGVYHFGESEGESDFIVLPYKNGLIVQISSHTWGKDPKTKAETWLREFKTFNNVVLKGSTFTFGKYTGTFVTYNGKIKKAILLNGDPSTGTSYDKNSAEAGHFETDLTTYFNGQKYPEISLQLIDEKYLEGKSKQEIKYMRNEVFARYGMIFQSPEVASLFSKRYLAWRTDVSKCLTEIEKYNLEVIKSYELKLK